LPKARKDTRVETNGKIRFQPEANATKMLSDAIAQGDAKALNYFLGVKYVEALQGIVTSPNQKLLMLPMDTQNLIGSLAGIAEIAKEVMDNKK
jgi:regulator of protease activity HflC (stomatin/prohibitin superfamily)